MQGLLYEIYNERRLLLFIMTRRQYSFTQNAPVKFRSQTICKSYARKNTHRELINIHEATLMFFRNTWADRMVLR